MKHSNRMAQCMAQCMALGGAVAALTLVSLRVVAADAVAADTPPAAPAAAAVSPAAATPAVKKSTASNKSVSGTKAEPKAATKQNEHIELNTTQITGNKELPKVMYVVPWKKADLGDFGGKPAKSLLDEVLAPVDRDVFKRQTRYYDALQPDAASAAAAGNEK